MPIKNLDGMFSGCNNLKILEISDFLFAGENIGSFKISSTLEYLDIIQVNVEKYQEILEAEINCTIIEINGSNYTLNCTGEKNILYDLQSAVSIINDDLLLINFDENITSKIIFGSNSNRYIKGGSNGVSGGIIAIAIIIPLIFIAAILALILLRKKIVKKSNNDAQDSAVVDLDI